MRFLWLLLVVISTALVHSSPVFAQAGASGSITGSVADESGNPLSGVKVKVTSSALMGPGKVVTSNADGSYVILGLPPGTYRVEAASEGMKPAIQDAVKVGIGAPAEVTVIMEVKAAEGETITIIEKPPMISTSKPAIQTKVELKTVMATPSPDIINVFRDQVEKEGGVSASRRVRGAPARGTLFTQDGFEIKEQFPSARSWAAAVTSTAGYGADAPTATGGVVNLVTRSGSNQTLFEFSTVADGSFSRLFLDRGESLVSQKRWLINPTLSGPIVRDRLWYHLNVETVLEQQGQARDPLLVLPQPSPYYNFIPKVTAKVSWQVNSRNKIDLLLNGDWPYQRNQRREAGIADEAQADRLAQRYFTGVIWQSSLSEDVLFRSQLGYGAFLEHIYPANCRAQPEVCHTIPNVRQRLPTPLEFGNAPKHDRNNLQYLQFINSIEYFLSTKHAGDHSLKFYDKLYGEQEKRTTSENGDVMYERAGTTNVAATTFYSNDPRLEDGRYGPFSGTVQNLKHQLTGSDTWKINRYVTTTPALSLIQVRGASRAGEDPFRSWISTWTLAPSLSAVWDVAGNAQTVVNASGSVYADTDLQIVGRHAYGSQVSQRCQWNAATQQYDYQCTYSGGAKNTISPDITLPRVWEGQLGAAQQLSPAVAVRVDGIYRKFTNQFEDFETNRIWNRSGTAVLGYRNGVAETIMDLQTPDSAEKTYVGTTLGLTINDERTALVASYTLQRLYGTVLDPFQNYYGTIPAQDAFLYGPLADDNTHMIKIWGSYDLAPWFTGGINYRYYSGGPTYHLYYNSTTGTYIAYRAQNGLDPGANLNDPADDRTLRLPDQMRLDIKFTGRLKPFIRQNLDLTLEILNLLALRTATSLGVQDGRDFGLTTNRVPPLTFRVGLNYATN